MEKVLIISLAEALPLRLPPGLLESVTLLDADEHQAYRLTAASAADRH